MRLTTAIHHQSLTPAETQARLAALEREDASLAVIERRLASNLDALTAATADLQQDGSDREKVATEIAKVRAERESVERVKKGLREARLSREARMQAIRFGQLVGAANDAIAEDAEASRQLRDALKGLGTLYKNFARTRQRAWERLVALDAQPDAASWRTWSQSPILYLVADAIPLPEFRFETQRDVQRPRLLSLREWRAEIGLSQAISDGSAVKRVFKHESPETLNRIEDAMWGNPQVVQILKTTESHTQHKAASKKPAKRGKK